MLSSAHPSAPAPCHDVEMAHESWDSTYWENHAVSLLTRHFGVDKVIRVPDEDGGDRGLDAFTVDGIGFQCYAPENEPLAPSVRAQSQKNKIHKDLKKFKENAGVLQPLLGDVKIHTWVLLTPVHESARVIEYCNTKASEVAGWSLPYASHPFRVQVHDLQTYAPEHNALSQFTPLHADVLTPVPKAGIDFAMAIGSHIVVMDAKLTAIPALVNQDRRDGYRAALLEGQFNGDSLLDRFRTRIPDLATLVEAEIDAALREMVMSAIAAIPPAQFLVELRERLVRRFSAGVAHISQPNAESLADKCISDWLQQCPLQFEGVA